MLHHYEVRMKLLLKLFIAVRGDKKHGKPKPHGKTVRFTLPRVQSNHTINIRFKKRGDH